jgi:diacylglycerol kinase family enzyme
MRSRWKKHRLALEKCLAEISATPPRKNCGPAGTAANFGAGNLVASGLAGSGLVTTDAPGSATKIAGAVIGEAVAELKKHEGEGNSAPFYLIITAGGDGTSLEVLSVLYNAPEEVRLNTAVLRLPMGTGNDGADSPGLAGALELLLKPSRIELTPALRLLTAPGGIAASKAKGKAKAQAQAPFLAFNILSVGLDAFVTHMTNRMKGKLPGDFYKLWVDLAALFYDRLYTVDFLDVKVSGEESRSFREKILLLAVGVSGHRTYGSQKKILPDDRNVCALKQMPLLRKLALKGLFSTGEHIDKPEAVLFNAHRVEFSGSHPILAQMDGETVLLQKEDFPAAIELTDPVIPFLKLLSES